ncbi:MAG: hypothetical protein FJW66_05070, partial [Actinobacteria bacterium]|nr:hypothetical protein [Actinomycetota bacterium]
MRSKILKITTQTIILAMFVFVLAVSGFACTKIVFISGVSSGYYIWEDSAGKIHVAWGMEKNESTFKGSIVTDGKISIDDKTGFNEDDTVSLNNERNRLEFDTKIKEGELSQAIVLDVENYSYLEFELKINGGYDLDRTHVGEYLANPDTPVFKISSSYFDDLKKIPFYRKPPLSGLFYKLSRDFVFTLIFVFVLGALMIEIIRITAMRKNRKYNRYLFLCYGIL